MWRSDVRGRGVEKVLKEGTAVGWKEEEMKRAKRKNKKMEREKGTQETK